MTASGAAISGLGMTRLGRVYGSSPRRLAASAVRLAAADAGMAVADVDGLLICPGISGGLDVGLASVLGLRDLALLAVVNSFGASAATAVQVAAQAVTSGPARAVACVFADTPLREGAPAGSAFGSHGGAAGPGGAVGPGGVPERHGLAGLAAGYGFRSVTVHYALAARRHMERYGTTSEQLGAIAVAQRRWAAGNPAAQYRDPITLADHQRSRWVAEPLHLLDCSVVSNGAVAVIVTSAAAAAAGPRPAVHVWGWGQGHPGHPMASGSDFGLGTGAVQAGRAAMGMAGIGPADVTMGQIYDCYTYTVLVTLEDYGFCAKGEGGAFAASGALAPGGSLPVNTGGGQLSAYYMWGFTPLSEAIIQARGDGGTRQSAATDVILVSGNGGILAHHGTLVLSPHPAEARPSGGGRAGGDRAGSRNPAGCGDRAGQLETGSAEAPAAGRAGQGEAGGHLTLAGAGDFGIVRADPPAAPFFDGARRGELMIRRCERCAIWLAPTARSCPGCGEDADELAWAAASGRGTLMSWSVVHPRHDGPVAVPALVELAEGPWLATGLRLSGPEQLAALGAGQPVVAEFVSPADGASYPVFRPGGSTG
ncbi:MAG TPA: OB-fold domain-containing protein [Streptosporangiaceae bacterium]|nr:OB-fold domain-containing protein [Streptosporangiaceae bacterium]